ncbi:MAG: hypothetical protein ACR2RB_13075 [Gammaproteobacteria bacterium]
MQGSAQLPLIALTTLALLFGAPGSVVWAKGKLQVAVPPGSASSVVAVKIIKAHVKRKYVFVKLAIDNTSEHRVDVFRDLIILQTPNGAKRGAKIAKKHQFVGPYSSKKLLGLKYYDVDLNSAGYSVLFSDGSVQLGGENVRVAPAQLAPEAE